MKQVTQILLFLLTSICAPQLLAQNQMNYQGVLRSSEGQILADESFDLRFQLQSENQIVFEEEHLDLTTDKFGVFQAGIGTIETNALADIDFSQSYQVQVSIRLPNASNYVTLHRSPLAAAPYAMHAQTAENVNDADADPKNEMQTLTFDAANNLLKISGGNEIQIPTGGSDADVDPENEIQILSKSGNKIKLSDGGSVTDETEDADADPENEIQALSLEGNTIKLSRKGGEINLPQMSSPWKKGKSSSITYDHRVGIGVNDPSEKLTVDGRIKASEIITHTISDPEKRQASRINLGLSPGMYRIPRISFDVNGNNDVLKIHSNGVEVKDQLAVDGSIIAGPIRGSLFEMSNVKILPAGNGSKGLRLENNDEILASFDASSGNKPPSLNVEQIKIGKGKIKLFSQPGFEGEFWVAKEGLSEKLMRIGEKTSAINTGDLFVSDHLHIYHPSHAKGQTGLQIYNLGSNHNYWNLYTSNSNGNLEFWFKGAIKARISSSNGSLITNSDRRLKESIRPLESVLPLVMKLEPKRYLFKNDASLEENIGFITQEVEALIPDLVHTEGADNFQGLNYQEFSVLAIKAIQEQNEIIESQDAEIKFIKDEMTALKEAVGNLIENK